MYKRLLSLAIPNIITNITIPLVGMADLVIVGLLGSDTLLAGIAIGTAMFNLLYWNFGFLRMGTSGLAAQAYGGRDFSEAAKILIRAVIVALLISVMLIALQRPLEWATLWFMEGSPAVESAAADYFRVRIWAAPATLSLYAFKGWFIGMQNSRLPMWVAIAINVVNVVMSYLCAVTFGGGIVGVAVGTVIAQWSGVVLAMVFLWRYYRRFFNRVSLGEHIVRQVFVGDKIRRFFVLNRDIFIRTLCLVAVFTYFTKASSAAGDTVLAANTLLLQLFTLFSYFMDGFAYAGEALAGRYYGAGSHTLLSRAVTVIFRVGFIVAILFSALYLFAGHYILMLFTGSATVLAEADNYIVWAAVVPVVGFAAFLWDGILVGMTLSKILRDAMLWSTVVFFAVYFALRSAMGNDALWLAFLVYLFLRGVIQYIYVRKKI